MTSMSSSAIARPTKLLWDSVWARDHFGYLRVLKADAFILKVSLCENPQKQQKRNTFLFSLETLINAFTQPLMFPVDRSRHCEVANPNDTQFQ